MGPPVRGLCPQPAWASWLDDGEAPEPGGHEEAYRLRRRRGAVTIDAATEVGRYRARSTLAQLELLERMGRPVPEDLEVVDRPVLDRRGVMLDVSRGRVPTVATLEWMIERLAALKVNHLELYLEASFDHPGHEEVCRPVGPYTADDVERLVRHATRHHVELVGQQNCLGHMERWLAHPDHAALAALPGGYSTPDGTAHEPAACLDPALPASWQLAAELVTNVARAFDAARVHVGLDEPIDLNPAVWDAIFDVPGAPVPWSGVDNGSFCVPLPPERRTQYMEWVRRLRNLPALDGRDMLMWADVMAPHPELLDELPGGVTLVEWGYEADHPFDERCGRISAAGVPFWVAPGTSGWTSISGRWHAMRGNVEAAAAAGVRHGAAGMLVATWLTLPSVSDWPGFTWAAALGWNPGRPPDLAAALDLVADGTAGLGEVWRRLGEVHDLVAPAIPEAGSVSEMFRTSGMAAIGLALNGMTPAMLDDVDGSLAAADELLRAARPAGSSAELFREELAWVAGALRWGTAAARHRLDWADPDPPPGGLRSGLARLVAEEDRLWRLRNRPEGHEVVAARLAAIGEDV